MEVGSRGSKKHRERRSGEREVVSTLLLVAIVVALGVIVFTFASGGLSSLTQSFTGLISGQGEQTVAEHPGGSRVTPTFAPVIPYRGGRLRQGTWGR